MSHDRVGYDEDVASFETLVPWMVVRVFGSIVIEIQRNGINGTIE